MIVLIRQTPGDSWQGLALEAPDELPSSIWHGTAERVKSAYRREYRGTELQFISLSEGWDKI